MKKFLSFLALSFCALTVNAQATHNMKITFQDGNTVVYGMENVKTVEFVEKEEPSAKETYTINGVEYPMPEAVDLGLPSGTKWASMNVGASSSVDGGLLFAFADPIYRGDDYDFKDYIYNDPANVNFSLYKCMPPLYNTIGTAYDIATVNIGEKWCMPSSGQLKELIDCCTFEFNLGLSLFIVTGPNNNSIYLPCSFHYEVDDWYVGSYLAGNIVSKNKLGCQLWLNYVSNELSVYVWGDKVDDWDGFELWDRHLIRPVLHK